MKKLILTLLALLALTMAAGCAYSGATWNAKTGKMYVTKNTAFFGLARAIYECTPAGTSFNCQPMPDNP